MDGNRSQRRDRLCHVRIRRALLLIAALTVTACSSTSQSARTAISSISSDLGTTSGIGASTPSTFAVPTIAGVCPENELTNLPQPDQSFPTGKPAEVAGIHVSFWPEGPEIDVGDPTVTRPTPALTAAFAKAKAVLKREIPALLPQGCCQGGQIIYVRFADGQTALYGPCLLPSPINEVYDLLTAAYFSD